MKKVKLIGLFMAIFATANSQVSISIPVGVSTLKTPTAGMNLQGRIGGLIIAGGFDSHVSSKAKYGNLIWSRIGAAFNLSDLNSLEISGGAGKYSKSAENKSLNVGLAVVNVQYVHQMASRPEASLFASVNGTKEFAMFTGGLRFTFGKGRSGCSSNMR